MLKNHLIIDVATAPIDDAGSYLEPVSAPSNWKDPVKIAAYVSEKTAERTDSAGLDLDLSRLTAIGTHDPVNGTSIVLAKTEVEEVAALETLAATLASQPTIITYNGFSFDLPLLQRRARYLGVRFPWINLDRYKSSHVDLMEILTDRNPQRRRPLTFYVRRLGWTYLEKPMSGAEESRVIETGRWDDLAASVRHDVTATYLLAGWLGVIRAEEVS